MIRILIMRTIVPRRGAAQGPGRLRQGTGQAAARAQPQCGMTQSVLQAVRTDVFNVAAPIAP